LKFAPAAAGTTARYLAGMSDDEVSSDELQRHVEHLHECKARFVEAVEVHETHEGKTVWQGAVKIFDLTGHPKAKRAYAWSYATEGGKRRFVAVLGLPPVDGPVTAVRAAVLASANATN
jgi:hypothetical protein